MCLHSCDQRRYAQGWLFQHPPLWAAYHVAVLHALTMHTRRRCLSQHRWPPILGVYLFHVEEPSGPRLYSSNMLRLWSVHAQRARMRGAQDPFVRNTRCTVQVSSGNATMTYKTRVSTCGKNARSFGVQYRKHMPVRGNALRGGTTHLPPGVRPRSIPPRWNTAPPPRGHAS